MTSITAVRPRLFLSQDPGLDRLMALEFGCTDDGQPSDRWIGVGEHVGLLHDEPDGRCRGFIVKRASAYDPDDPDNAELWIGPRFDVPALGLTDIAPNAVFVATRALYGGGPTVNRELFSNATGAYGEVALRRWLRCLQAGDSMAHFALGYTLFELGRIPEAYRHLRHYCEIAPGEAWNWVWLGKAAAAMGELGEARAAYERAIAIDDGDDDPSDAAELLANMDAGRIEIPERQPSEHDPSWQAALSALVASIWLSATTWSTNAVGHTLFNVLPCPVWLDVDGSDGELQIRAMIGSAPGASNTPDGAENLLSIACQEGDDIVIDGDDLWLVVPVAERLADLAPRTLELLVLGAATSADCIRAAATRDDGSAVLVAPPDRDEAERLFDADR